MRIPPTAISYGLLGPEPVRKEHDRPRSQQPEREKHPQAEDGSPAASEEEATATHNLTVDVRFEEVLDEAEDQTPLGTYDRSIVGSHRANGSAD